MFDRKKYSREWVAKRRAEWFALNGPCIQCGSWKRLELDHIDPSLKVANSIWSWTRERQEEEIAKCQILCHECHLKKTARQRRERITNYCNRGHFLSGSNIIIKKRNGNINYSCRMCCQNTRVVRRIKRKLKLPIHMMYK